MYKYIAKFVALMVISTSAIVASSGPPTPYFSNPSYIDPDFRSPYYAEWAYGRTVKFHILLDQYVYVEKDLYVDRDIDARMVSSEKEPERFNRYQQGAEYFRSEFYDSALTVFLSLMQSDSANDYSWAAEASAYMAARCNLIMSQKDWNGYQIDDFAINKDVLTTADSLFLKYIDNYPSGLYVTSALAIRRRIFYLACKQTLLDQELKREMSVVFPSSSGFTLGAVVSEQFIGEFQRFFKGKVNFAQDSPILTAFAWLGNDKPDSSDLIALEAREADFAPYPRLFNYVRALGLYKLERYHELLAKTPKDPPESSKLWLSAQLLRARAFARTGDIESAVAVLKAMRAISNEVRIEIEIALIKFNSGDGLWLYSNRTPFTNERLLSSLALLGLSDSELVAGIKRNDITGGKRQILVQELAMRYCLSGHVQDLTSIIDAEEVGVLESIRPMAARLASDPRDVEAVVAFGEFMYEKGLNPRIFINRFGGNAYGGSPADDLPQCQPCKTFGDRIATYQPPIRYFRWAVEVSKQKKKRSEFEAKALHYVVRGGRSGYKWMVLSCWRYHDNKGEYAGESRNAFIRLHRLYPDSPWATKTPYWYK